jgi:hypothetical protein
MVQELHLGRIVLRILIGALCVAAAVASYALLGGEFSDTDWKVIATSALFALTSSLAAAGLGVRERARLLGDATVAAAGASFLLVSFDRRPVVRRPRTLGHSDARGRHHPSRRSPDPPGPRRPGP